MSAKTGRDMDRLTSPSAGNDHRPVWCRQIDLINRLYGRAIQATAEVRKRDSKGRHTTAWRELILLPQAECSSTRRAAGLQL